MGDVEIVEDTFGVFPNPEESIIKRFTLTNSSGFAAQVINYGATLTTLKVPDRNGEVEDVILGFDDIEGYLGLTSAGGNPYFGGSIGRSSNRVANGRFTMDGTAYQLTLNDGANHLHGGFYGFDKKLWDASVNGSRVTFSYICKDGEEGYPGDVLAQITYEVTSDNRLILQYNAMVNQPTPISFTNHTYFNLAGHTNADQKLVGHTIMINARNYTPVDENLIITGEIRPVVNTIYDLTTPKDLNSLLQEFPAGPNGFDNNFCINQNPDVALDLAARVEESVSGRVLEVYSDRPGLQFYTSNLISETEPIVGKGGAGYYKHGAMCLETQNYPDAVNNPNFPDPILRPGTVYSHRAVYQFKTIEAGK